MAGFSRARYPNAKAYLDRALLHDGNELVLVLFGDSLVGEEGLLVEDEHRGGLRGTFERSDFFLNREIEAHPNIPKTHQHELPYLLGALVDGIVNAPVEPRACAW